MKIRLSIIVLFLVCLITQCTQEPHRTNPMGTWILIEGKRISENTEEYTMGATKTSQHLKIINGTHFATIWQDKKSLEKQGFNGGSYKFENGIYTEYLEYFSAPELRGDTAFFRAEINGELMTLSSCNSTGDIIGTGYLEVWKKMN